MQSSIMSFFKKPSSSGVKKPSKRTKALSPAVAAALKEEVTPTGSKHHPKNSVTAKQSDQQVGDTLSPSVRAKIEGNRAAARLRRIRTMKLDLNTVIGMNQALEPSWRDTLCATLEENFWPQLIQFLSNERKSHTIYPPIENIFSAFNHSTFPRTRVVIIGQDPYHGPRQAHGMSFSVPDGVFPPPSLLNIFRELENDIEGFTKPKSGCLEKWANQGVLLLNSVLSVRRANPASHQGRGWERFTDGVVHALNHREDQAVVFMLWGGYAKKKGAGINRARHCVLQAVHPSPLSANRGGWFGNKHFSKANEFLKKNGLSPIEWKLE